MMAELIDRQALLETLMPYVQNRSGDIFDAIDEIKAVPAVDAVEMVRCKGCRFCKQNRINKKLYCFHKNWIYDHYFAHEVTEEHFCGYNEPQYR